MKSITISSIFILLSITILNGQTTGWVLESSPVIQNLHGVTHIDTNQWFAVGDGGTIIRSENGGNHWVQVSSPVTDALQSISFLANVGLAVGIAGRVVRTTDSGLTWFEQPRPTTKNLYAVSMSSAMTVATGEEGTILVSYDKGLTWVPHTAGTASFLFGVSVNDSTAVAVGGAGAIVMSVDNGVGWGLTVLGNQLTFFYSASFVTGSTGWAVGSTSSPGNVIIKSTDFGFAWSGETAPTNEQLFGVSFSDLNNGTAVGGNGSIIHTADGGATWLNQNSGTVQILHSVSFANPQLGIAVGDGGTILKTTTGGVESVESPLQPNSLRIYPDPASDIITLNFHDLSKDCKLTIFNPLGQVVRNESISENHRKLNVSDLSNGIYLLMLKTPSMLESRRFIISR